jgi:hypothetical protein
MQIGDFFLTYDVCESAQWEANCGLTLRVGSKLFALGHLGYREKSPAWPRWLRFGVSIAGPLATSMSWRRTNYLYLFGRRVFDTRYWLDCRKAV